MKRYFAFYNYKHMPSTGMEDSIGDFDTIPESVKALWKNNLICHWANKWQKDDEDYGQWNESFIGIVWDSEKRENVHTINDN